MLAHQNYAATATGTFEITYAPNIRFRGNMSAHSAGVTNCYIAESDGHLILQIAGLTTGTFAVEASLDETTWVAVEFTPMDGGASVASFTGNGIWRSTIPLAVSH